MTATHNGHQAATDDTRVAAEVWHPQWCDRAVCSIDANVDDGSVHRYHWVSLFDETTAGERLRVELYQTEIRAPSGEQVTLDASLYIDIGMEGRVQVDQIHPLAVALHRAAELIGWPVDGVAATVEPTGGG